MIVADRKPFDEIMAMVAPYSRILLLGCNACVAVCAAGGAREVALLASQVRLARAAGGVPAEIAEATIERNCDAEFVAAIGDAVEGAEAVLSMACGCGVQFVGERFPRKPVFPALNTTFDGVTAEPGLWLERCQGCGNCILHTTGGLCPVTRCAKSLFNGPCGGSREGRCEVDRETPCVWQLIVERLSDAGQMERYLETAGAKDWSTSRDSGPRKRIREDLSI